MTHMLYTFGYAGSTPETIWYYVESLNALLVDIRYRPYSRDPRWDHDALQDLVGRRYLHVRGLGNVNYRGGPIRLYATEAAAIALRPLLERQAIILMCACKDWRTCHRKEAAEFLARELGAEVEHLPGAPLAPAEQGVLPIF